MQNMPIAIFRGDDTDALGYQTIVGTIKTDLDLTGCKAVFRYLSFSAEFDPIPEDKKLTVIIPASETKKFPPGLGYASLRVYDAEGKLCTFSNRIMVFVATKTPMFGNEEFEVDFNVRPELEPLRIFVGPNPGDFDEYRGFLEKVIDRASAAKYGLAMLLDAIDSDLGADDGVAATPAAVKAAYAAVIGKLTDEYYTKEETDEAIDRVAAYYITYDAAGNPFPTYAALANATTVYSGGKVRTPTRNDYCVVLADETHQGAEYRYIYAVAEGETTGSWQPQFPVEGVMTVDQTVTKDSQNPVSGGGVWSAIWGTLSALPTGFSSLYDWCVNKLSGKVDASGGRAAQLRLLIAATTGSSAGLYSLRVKYDGTTYNNKATLEIVKQPAGPAASEVIVASIDLPASDGTLALLQNIAPNFSASATYALDALCVYGGALYHCTTAVTTAGAWTGSTNWTAATVDDVLAALRAAIPTASTSTPLMDGTGSAGSSAAFARGDHRHPSDTSKVDDISGTAHLLKLVDGTNQRVVYFGKDASYSMTTAQLSGGQLFNEKTIIIPRENGTLALTAGTGHTGNLAALDANGNPTDSTIPAANVALKSAIPYSIGDPIVIDTASSETVEGETVYYGAATMADRTSNIVQVTAATALDELRITFPAPTRGKVRDFGLRVEVGTGSAALAAPALVPIGSTGETIKIENADRTIPELADGTATAKGVTLLYFSETAPGVFVVKGEQVEEVA